MTVLVVFLDGATWKLLDPWIRDGELPTFKYIKENGVSGILKSTIPPSTSPAIPSFYTGKNPGKHGVLGFLTEDGKIVNSYFIKDRTLWDIISDAGLKSCIINLPITYPPRKINGVMISGFPIPSNNVEFTYPKDLKKEIEDYPAVLEFEKNLEESSLPDEYIFEKQLEVTKKRFDTLENIIRRENFDFVLFFVKGTDILQHLFWNRRDLLLKYYKELDKRIV